jgi:hypothetical protein
MTGPEWLSTKDSRGADLFARIGGGDPRQPGEDAEAAQILATILADLDVSAESAIRDSLRADLLERLRSTERRHSSTAVGGGNPLFGNGIALLGRLCLIAGVMLVGLFFVSPARSWIPALVGEPGVLMATQTSTMTPTRTVSLTPTLVSTASITNQHEEFDGIGRADLRVAPSAPLPTPETPGARNQHGGSSVVWSRESGAESTPQVTLTGQPGA